MWKLLEKVFFEEAKLRKLAFNAETSLSTSFFTLSVDTRPFWTFFQQCSAPLPTLKINPPKNLKSH